MIILLKKFVFIPYIGETKKSGFNSVLLNKLTRNTTFLTFM